MSSSYPSGSLGRSDTERLRRRNRYPVEIPPMRFGRSSREYDREYVDSPRGSHSREYYEPEGARYANPRASAGSNDKRSWINDAGDDGREVYSREDLLATLNVDSKAEEQTLSDALNSGKPLNDDTHGRVQFVLRDSDFRRWMTDNQSRIIVIDGPLDGDTFDKRSSALTSYAAGLHGWNERINDSPSLSFFCGYFEDPSEEITAVLLRSLCDQLLRNKKLSENFECSLSAEEAQRLEGGYSKELFILLGSLVMNIIRSGGRLLCTIDGLHRIKMEDTQQFKELLTFFENLCHEANEPGHNAVLKLVLTYPQLWDQELFHCHNTKRVSDNMVPRSDVKRNENGLTTGYQLNAILRQST